MADSSAAAWPAPTAEERFRHLVESAQELIYVCNARGQFTYVNPTAVRTMRYEEGELIGRHFLRLIRPDYQAQVAEVYARQMVDRAPNTYLEFPSVTKTGETVWVSQNVQLLFEGETITGAQAIARDITQQKNTEERLRWSEARYRSLVEGAAYGIYRTNVEGQLLQVNPALITMVGYESAAELLAAGEMTAVYQDPAIRRELIARCRASGRLDGVDVLWKRKDGTPLTVRLSARTVNDGPGHVSEFEVIAEDVSERRRLEDQLRQAQKIEVVGQLAGGIAHNFNNLLTAILGYCELLIARPDTTDAARADLEEIQKAGQRASVLTGQLLTFSRKHVPMPEEIDLNRTVRDLQHMLRRVIREDMTLTCDLAATPALVRIDPSEVEQAILNLVLNARDALPGGGQILIHVAHAQTSQPFVQGSQFFPPGEYVRLAVSDNGSGISPDVLPHLFEPFFTTKAVGKGTGLGLASVYGIVQHSGGFISVDTTVGKGTTFALHFPPLLQAQAPAKPQQAPARVVRSQAGGTILLVEDEDAVRAVISALLTKHGYRVLEAPTPRAATSIFEEHAREIDLLLTDVVMAETNGPALAQRLIGLRPDLQVLFISGYTGYPLSRDVGNSKRRFLSKPFQPSALVSAVDEMLNPTASL